MTVFPQNMFIMCVFDSRALNHYFNLHFCFVNEKTMAEGVAWFCSFVLFCLHSDFRASSSVLGSHIPNQRTLKLQTYKSVLDVSGSFTVDLKKPSAESTSYPTLPVCKLMTCLRDAICSGDEKVLRWFLAGCTVGRELE